MARQLPARIFTRNLQLVEDTERTLRETMDHIQRVYEDAQFAIRRLRERVHTTPAQFEDFGGLDSLGQYTDALRYAGTTHLGRVNKYAHEALDYFDLLAQEHMGAPEEPEIPLRLGQGPQVAPWLMNTAKLPPRRNER